MPSSQPIYNQDVSSDYSNYRLKISRGPRNELQYMSVLLSKIKYWSVLNCIISFMVDLLIGTEYMNHVELGID